MKVLARITLLSVMAFNTACFSTVLGIKSYDTDAQGTHIKFVTGFDVGASANGVDSVENVRGIAPEGRHAQQTNKDRF